MVGTVYWLLIETPSVPACWSNLPSHLLSYCLILAVCIVVEALVAQVAMRGTILDPQPRSSMQYLLYIRLGGLLQLVGFFAVG